jgi:hypothetical protein
MAAETWLDRENSQSAKQNDDELVSLKTGWGCEKHPLAIFPHESGI